MINGRANNVVRNSSDIMRSICSYNNGCNNIPSIKEISERDLHFISNSIYYKTSLFTKNTIPKEDKTNEKEKED